ncbi:MFS transporter [Paenibacillus sp. JNUCC31]|uniref:MFS transporter n=1 Tax=Paenibacillus sp. JNUCC-31 TaxID=2777983 RepID=UPI0017831358|nr:MFS transporter [Paenibacillus sp. JNUCC-31]QOS81246.1 MFS transporter [Paenibacillus sp. JNUCC-31]
MSKISLGLLKQNDFRNFWLGHTVSSFGVQITTVAIPLIAALTMHASPLEMGFLTAVEFLPFLLISLFVGVWVDRKPKRPMMIAADIVRAVALIAIPVGIFMDILTMPLLYIIAAIVGINTVIFEIAHVSYLPTVVKKDELVEGNSKLEFSSSSATVVGQSIGGALIQIFSAPFSILFNIGTYLVSAVYLARIKKQEDAVEVPEGTKQNMGAEIREGAKFVFHNNILRAILIGTVIFNLFTYVIEPIFILYISRTLALAPVYIGLIFSMSGVGALLGAFVAGPMVKKLGIGKTMVTSLFLAGLVSLVIPVATLLPTLPAVILIMVMYMIDAAMVIVYNINQRSLRQGITPQNLQGRMNACMRMFGMGVVPIGAVLGGWLGGIIGTTPTLIVGAIGLMGSSIFIVFSSVRTITQPAGPDVTSHGG